MMSCIWQPGIPPPDPASVSGLSADADKVLKALYAQYDKAPYRPIQQGAYYNPGYYSTSNLNSSQFRSQPLGGTQDIRIIQTPQQRGQRSPASVSSSSQSINFSSQRSDSSLSLLTDQRNSYGFDHKHDSGRDIYCRSGAGNYQVSQSRRADEKQEFIADFDDDDESLFDSMPTSHNNYSYSNNSKQGHRYKRESSSSFKMSLKSQPLNSQRLRDDAVDEQINGEDDITPYQPNVTKESHQKLSTTAQSSTGAFTKSDKSSEQSKEYGFRGVSLQNDSLAGFLVSQLGQSMDQTPLQEINTEDSPPLDLSQEGTSYEEPNVSVGARKPTTEYSDPVQYIGHEYGNDIDGPNKASNPSSYGKCSQFDNEVLFFQQNRQLSFRQNSIQNIRDVRSTETNCFNDDVSAEYCQNQSDCLETLSNENMKQKKLKQSILSFTSNRGEARQEKTANEQHAVMIDVDATADADLKQIETLCEKSTAKQRRSNPGQSLKKPVFVAPIKISRNLQEKSKTQIEENLKIKSVTQMNETSNQNASKVKQSRDVTNMSLGERNQTSEALEKSAELAFCVYYTDFSSQLTEPESSTAEAGIAVASQTILSPDASTTEGCVMFPFCCVDLDIQEWIRNLLLKLLCGKAKKLCFEAQHLVFCVLKHLKLSSSDVTDAVRLFDPQVAAWLLDPDQTSMTFHHIISRYTSISKEKTDSDPKQDICASLLLMFPCMKQLEEKLCMQKLWKLFLNVETPLCPMLAAMETRSIQIDTKTLQHFAEILKKKITKLETSACQIVGFSFSLNSPAQLRQVLFENLQLDKKLPRGSKNIERTSSGREKSTSESVLSRLESIHPLPGIVLEHRQLQKLKSTYVDGLLSYVRAGQLSTRWDQTSAATGRLASTNPNVQSVPKQPTLLSGFKDNFIIGKESRDERIHVRQAFISRPGHSFITADFQQMELRLLAHLSDDTSLIELFARPDSCDVFIKLTAQWIIQTLQWCFSKRMKMSQVGKEKLADYLKVTCTEASAVMNSFLVKFPAINSFTKKCIEDCEKQSFLTTIFGRRRLFPNIKHHSAVLRAQSVRQAVNFTVQGSAADICKAAMLQVEHKLAEKRLKASLLLQIHDELLLEVEDSQIRQVASLLRCVMEDASALCGDMARLRVPLQISLSVGKSWGQLQPYNQSS